MVAAWGIWCAFFLKPGLDLRDLGMYCSDAWRLANGDQLLRDTSPAIGLSPWFLSLSFRIFPECNLIGLRVIWAIVMLLYALLTAKLMLRYFNPVVSFVGVAASLFFVTGGLDLNLRVLSYNTMPVFGLLLTTLLWLAASRRTGKRQILLAVGAGIGALLATACRISLLPVIFLPLLTLVYDRCCGIRMDGWMRATIAYSAAYLGGLACFFIALGAGGLLNDFIAGIMSVSDVAGHSSQDMVYRALHNCSYLLLGALPVIVTAFLFNSRGIIAFLKSHKKTVGYVFFLTFFSCLLIAIIDRSILYYAFWAPTHPINAFWAGLPSSWTANWLCIGLAIGFVLVATTSHVFDSSAKKGPGWAHDRYRLGTIALFLSLLMILGTNVVPAYSVRCISWLTISTALGILYVWISEHPKDLFKTWFVRLAGGAFVVLLLLYSFNVQLSALNLPMYDKLPMKGGGYIEEQIVEPTTAKLQGILTTSDRAYTVDRLAEAVELYSEPGDRILAYENLPILYYLTDRLPSTRTTWLGEFLNRPLRESILQDMITRGRTPQLVVRATQTRWSEKEQELDPIDKYVRDHYKVVDEIDGFQIMLPAD